MLGVWHTSTLAVDHALLVGVSEYPALPGKRLEGPANDLRLMRTSLRRLGFADDNVVELSEAAGQQQWPTRNRILQALKDLAARSRTGDWVLLYFSGHGTQVPQPASGRALRPEADGYDEVFLPRDAAHWDPVRKRVTGGIIDDEIGIALERIRARGASVWAIFDTCHAGDMTRSESRADAAVFRFVAPVELGVPEQAMHGRRKIRGAKPATPPPGIVAFFAAAADEPAPEELLRDPLGDGSVKLRFGVFTYELHRALTTWHGDFGALATRLQEAYRPRPFPSPQFEGNLKTSPSFAQTPR